MARNYQAPRMGGRHNDHRYGPDGYQNNPEKRERTAKYKAVKFDIEVAFGKAFDDVQMFTVSKAVQQMREKMMGFTDFAYLEAVYLGKVMTIPLEEPKKPPEPPTLEEINAWLSELIIAEPVKSWLKPILHVEGYTRWSTLSGDTPNAYRMWMNATSIDTDKDDNKPFHFDFALNMDRKDWANKKAVHQFARKMIKELVAHEVDESLKMRRYTDGEIGKPFDPHKAKYHRGGFYQHEPRPYTSLYELGFKV